MQQMVQHMIIDASIHAQAYVPGLTLTTCMMHAQLRGVRMEQGAPNAQQPQQERGA